MAVRDLKKQVEKTITYLIPDDRYNCIIHHDLLPVKHSPCISMANQSMAPGIIIPNSGTAHNKLFSQLLQPPRKDLVNRTGPEMLNDNARHA